jgi:hypothetical protein
MSKFENAKISDIYSRYIFLQYYHQSDIRYLISCIIQNSYQISRNQIFTHTTDFSKTTRQADIRYLLHMMSCISFQETLWLTRNKNEFLQIKSVSKNQITFPILKLRVRTERQTYTKRHTGRVLRDRLFMSQIPNVPSRKSLNCPDLVCPDNGKNFKISFC